MVTETVNTFTSAGTTEGNKPVDSSPVIEALMGRTIDAFAWRFLSEFARFGMQLVVMVVLARLLPVAAFGLLALTMIFVNLAIVVAQFGMTPALIQRLELSDIHLRVAFTVSALGGVLLTTLIWLLAPSAANIFHTADVTPFMRIISLSILFISLGSTAEALLVRGFEYKKLMRVELVSFGLGYVAVSVTLALLGFGAAALAWGPVAQFFTRSVLLFRASPHAVAPCLSPTVARDLLRFGTGASFGSMIHYAASYGDYFVVGRWLGETALGLYSRAFQLMSLPMYQFTSVISHVLFPTYSRMQNDVVRLGSGYYGSVSLTSAVVFPLLATMAVSAPESIVFLFGPQWTGAIAPLQILCLGGAFQSLYSLSDAMARAKGAVYAKGFRHLVYATCVVVGARIGSRWGIVGVAVGVTAATALIHLLMAQLVIRLTRTSWRDLCLALVPGSVIATAVVLIALPFSLLVRASLLPLPVTLGLEVFVAIATAVAVSLLLPMRLFNPVALRVVQAVKRLARQKVLEYLTLIRLDNTSDHSTSDDAQQICPLSKEHWKLLLNGHRRLYKMAETLYDNATYVHLIARAGLWKSALRWGRTKFPGVRPQAATVWDVALPAFGSPTELVSWCAARDIVVHEGAHTIYLPPQEALRTIIPQVVDFYPRGSGFKVLRDFRSPDRSSYLFKEIGCNPIHTRLVGMPQDLLIPANYLHALGLGPRVWDLAHWKGSGNSYTVFVVEHVSGPAPAKVQSEAFLNTLDHLNRTSPLRILVPSWKHHMDFNPPSCNENLRLVAGKGKPYYVDFQNFTLRNPADWSKEVKARVEAAHRCVTGQQCGADELCYALKALETHADNRSDRNWHFARQILSEASLDFNGRFVLDIGCNSARPLSAALSAGALWGVAWNRADVLSHVRNLLFSMGISRFQVMPANLHSGHRLIADVAPNLHSWLAESVAFYRPSSATSTVAPLTTIPWRALVYEGRETDSVESIVSLLRRKVSRELQVLGSLPGGNAGPGGLPVVILLRPTGY